MHAVSSEIAELRLASVDAQGNIISREFISAFERSDTQVRGLILFTAPESISGTVFLAVQQISDARAQEPEAHIYLPALNAIKKVNRSMPGQKQFFGSEFTWDDIMLESMTPQKPKWIRSTRIQGHPVDLIELTPTEGPAYLRDKRHVYIDSKSYYTHRVDVFSSGAQLLKTLTAYDYASPDVEGASKRPHRLVAQNISTLETSVLTLLRAKQNIALNASVFDPLNLERLSKAEEPEAILIAERK